MNSQLPGPLTVAAMQVTNRSNPLASNLIKPPVNRNPLASALEVGYADGGQVEETTDQMIARMAAKYGTGSAAPSNSSAAASTRTTTERLGDRRIAQMAPESN